MNDKLQPTYYRNAQDIDLISRLANEFTREQFRGAMVFNIRKYLERWENKNGIEDLEKAQTYLDRWVVFEKMWCKDAFDELITLAPTDPH